MQLRNADQQERDAEATLAGILKAVDGLAGDSGGGGGQIKDHRNQS